MKNRVLEMLKEKSIESSFPMKLQYFGPDEDNNDGSENDNEDSEDENEDDHPDDDGEDEKKFTQADMTATAAREKKQGRRSAYKELGFKSEKEAKAEMESYRKWKESQMTDDEKNQKAIDDANSEKSEAEKRAQAAEEKLSVMMAGVRKDSINDVLAIARGKVDEDKTLDDVLEDMKKEDRYKSFFNETEDGSKGTGKNLNHNRNRGKEENVGVRLAKQSNANNSQKKSSYFS